MELFMLLIVNLMKGFQIITLQSELNYTHRIEIKVQEIIGYRKLFFKYNVGDEKNTFMDRLINEQGIISFFKTSNSIVDHIVYVNKDYFDISPITCLVFGIQ